MGAGASFGELCVLGLSTVSLVDATCVVQSDFFFIIGTGSRPRFPTYRSPGGDGGARMTV